MGSSCPRTTNWPLSGRGLGYVTQFRNFGTPSIFRKRKKLRSSNLANWHAHRPWAVLAPGPQIGPKLGVAGGRCPNFEILGPPQYFYIFYINIFISTIFKFGTHMGRGQFLPMDHNLAPKWASPGVLDPFSKFWDFLNISQTGKATIFKFGMHIGRGQFLPMDHKLAPKWTWPT